MKTLKNSCFAILALLSVLLTACDNDMRELNKGEAPLAIAVNSTDAVLDITNPSGKEVVFSWTSGTNQGTNAAISYQFQLDRAGNGFAAAYDTILGKGIVSFSLTNDALNQILLDYFGILPGERTEMEARVIATVHSDGIEPQVSEAALLFLTPYKPVSKTLYLIGSAAPNGWSADNATKMNAITGTAGGFTWLGNLGVGELKFITTLGAFVPSYGQGDDAASLYYRESFDDTNDVSFNIATAGTYKVTVNIIALTISIEAAEGPEYSELWFVGGFSGWSFVKMRNDANNPNLFYYFADLSSSSASDEFKIATQQSFDDAVVYYRPATDQQGAGTDLDVVKWSINSNSSDHKWRLNTGAYKIKLNIQTMKIDIVPFTPYPGIYLIGSACTAGWDIANALPMTVDGGNPNIFRWTGALAAGELKFTCDKNTSWNGDWFLASEGGIEPAGVEELMIFSANGANPDNKWNIATPGTYNITLNQLLQTVTIARQ